MADYKVFREFDIKIDEKQVLLYMECTESNPMYEGLKKECGKLEGRLQSLVQPEAVVVFDTFEQAGAAYVLFSLGSEISEAIDAAFGQDSYMEGMLLDAMADNYLFQMGNQLEYDIKKLCEQRNCGVRKKLEAPADIPAHSQRTILEQIRAVTDIEVEITEGHMFNPVKTLAFILLLTEETGVFQPFHDCSSCAKTTCTRRGHSQSVEVLWQDRAHEIPLGGSCKEKEPESLYELLTRHGFPIPAPCGGNGSCGKCRIRLDYGELDITEADQQAFSEEELAQGWRLACRAYPQKNCTIELDDPGQLIQAAAAQAEAVHESGELGIAIDIGTTTLAFSLVNEEGKVVGSHVRMNRQKQYGADVISRQMKACAGLAEALQEAIKEDLVNGIRELRNTYGVDEEDITYIVMAGNTTMVHLLMGYSCDGLGKYPYHAVNLNRIDTTLAELTGQGTDIPVMIVPGISAYVGGDIVAGMLACEFAGQQKPVLLLDIGTNGEMAVGTRERILVTSAAAGPAFEGGNISCGMAGIEGAVTDIRITNGKTELKVIGDGAPEGICGTGVMEGISQLLEHGIAGGDGLMESPYFEEGFCFGETSAGRKLTLTQKDIREFQMAKGAIRAGADTLLRAYGIGYEELEAVYLAGGFGVYMNVDTAVHIGLLPETVRHKVIVRGNTALEGARLVLHDPGATGRMKRLINEAEEIHLSESEEFQELYMKHMYLNHGI